MSPTPVDNDWCSDFFCRPSCHTTHTTQAERILSSTKTATLTLASSSRCWAPMTLCWAARWTTPVSSKPWDNDWHSNHLALWPLVPLYRSDANTFLFESLLGAENVCIHIRYTYIHIHICKWIYQRNLRGQQFTLKLSPYARRWRLA